MVALLLLRLILMVALLLLLLLQLLLLLLLLLLLWLLFLYTPESRGKYDLGWLKLDFFANGAKPPLPPCSACKTGLGTWPRFDRACLVSRGL
jgi:hypothetical protein